MVASGLVPIGAPVKAIEKSDGRLYLREHLTPDPDGGLAYELGFLLADLIDACPDTHRPHLFAMDYECDRKRRPDSRRIFGELRCKRRAT